MAVTDKNWIVTYETEIPRVLPVKSIEKYANHELINMLHLLEKDNCKGIIAMSEAAKNIELKLIRKLLPPENKLIRKLTVLHPPQTVLSQKKEVNNGRLRLTFVGNEFYRKGGAEVVLAINELIEEGELNDDSLEVILIGDLTKRNNIAHGRFQDEESMYNRIEEDISSHSHFIHYTHVHHAHIIDHFLKSDLGLLPTWQETYGYSVLEMQACGCPVITTNIRALSEINPDSAGWNIVCSVNEDNEIEITSEEQKMAVRMFIIERLKYYIKNIYNNRDELKSKSDNALMRIIHDHNPETFINRINQIYKYGVDNSILQRA